MASGAVNLLQNALLNQSYGAYILHLQSEFGWSKTLVSGVAGAQQLVLGFTGPVVGIILDRLGPRFAMRVGLVLMAIGFVLLSMIHNAFQLYGVFMFLALGANLTGYLSTTFTVVHWFERRRSSALSLASVGMAFGGTAVYVVVLSLEHFGWRNTALISAAALLIIGLPLSQIFVHHPEDIGLEIDGGPARPKPGEIADADTPLSTRGRINFTLGEAMRHPTFWWICFGHTSALFVVQAVNVHLISDLTHSLGYSEANASLVLAGVTVMFGIGTVTGGLVGDRGDRQIASIACMAMHTVGMILLAYASNVFMVIGFVVVHGYAWGWRGPQMAALRADYFGREHFGKIIGVSNVVIIIGQITGPLIAGYSYDHTGSYVLGFDILAGIAAFGSIFFWLAKRPDPPARYLAASAELAATAEA